VFRGTLLPVETRSLTKTASDLFTTALAVPTLAVAELYGSKLVAAMDRQHPRDLFDVHGMFQRFGLTPEIVECFVGYIAGHNRPVHEVLGSRDIDLARPFDNEFAGMERLPVSLRALEEARIRLRRELAGALTADHKRFLIGLVAGQPPWEAMRCRHLAELPAIQWKLQNLARLKRTNAVKFQAQADELQRCFEG
jgi:Nucleotidyl transferase AbiEii toxin, Type IV TA system